MTSSNKLLQGVLVLVFSLGVGGLVGVVAHGVTVSTTTVACGKEWSRSRTQTSTPLDQHSLVPPVSTWFRRSCSTPHSRSPYCPRTTSPPAHVGALRHSQIRFAPCWTKTSCPLQFVGSCGRSRPTPSPDSRCGEWCLDRRIRYIHQDSRSSQSPPTPHTLAHYSVLGV